MLCSNKCPRGLYNCEPLSNIISDNKESFVCVGHSNPSSRSVETDKFRHCFVTEQTDSTYDYDEYDLISVSSV